MARLGSAGLAKGVLMTPFLDTAFAGAETHETGSALSPPRSQLAQRAGRRNLGTLFPAVPVARATNPVARATNSVAP